MKVQPGSLVSLEYDLLLDSGEQIDSSAVNGPLRLRVGEWEALPGLGEKLVGLQPGDERLRFETRDGASAACRLYHIEEGRVALDFNHPLAGEPLTVFVRIRRVVPPRRLKVGTAH